MSLLTCIAKIGLYILAWVSHRRTAMNAALDRKIIVAIVVIVENVCHNPPPLAAWRRLVTSR